MSETSQDQRVLLDRAFTGGDSSEIAAALLSVATARGMADIVREVGLVAEMGGDVRLSTLIAACEALGFKLCLQAAERRRSARVPPSGSMIYTVEVGAGSLPWLKK
jgi:DNA-binding phage protein